MKPLNEGLGLMRRTSVALGFLLLLGALVAVSLQPRDLAQASSASELPDAADVAEGLAQAEKEDEAAEVAREEPAAITERQESTTAFTDLDSDAARDLLHAQFHEQFDALNGDPARLLSDALLERVLEGGDAAVIVNDGEPQLLDAGIPVVSAEEGATEKVDLTLVEGDEGLEPDNPVISISLPEEASGAMVVGDRGLGISAEGVDEDSSVELFGDKNAFYFDAREDTDLIASPLSGGVEIFEQLRSEESPEELRYAIAMPAGAELVSDQNGGAQITLGGSVLGRIPFPAAVDAQGADVPVELEVEGESISLLIPHRLGDFAYPILVDPELKLEENWSSCSWYNNCNLAALDDPNVWVWGPGSSWIYGDRKCFWTCSWGSGRGLYVGAENGYHGPNEFGQWTYTPPGTSSSVLSATLNPFWRNNYTNCPASKYPQPHDYSGLWSPAYGWVPLQTEKANDVGSASFAGYGRVVAFGLGTGPQWAENKCNRTVMVAGVSVAITDPDVPSWTTAPTAPDTWTDTSVIPITGTASDNGLGTKYMNVYKAPNSGAGYDYIGNAVRNCSGLKQDACGASWTGQISNYSVAALPNGVNWLDVFAYDPLGVEHHSQGMPVHINVDHSKPTIAFSGELFGPSPNVYKGTIIATDGSSAGFSTAQSGMKSIQIYVDKVFAERWPDEANPPACNKPQQGINVASCQFELPFKMQRTLYGKHELEVRAFDSLNHEAKETVFLDLPKDVTAPTMTVSGPLKTAAGGWVSAGATTVTVEAQDAAAGVIEDAVYVDGTKVAQATQECYAGGCSFNRTLNVSLAGYSNGTHTVKAVAKDSVGLLAESSWSVKVDATVPSLDSVTAPGVPAGWTPQLSSFNLNYSASDSGSGVKKVEISRPSSTGSPLVSTPFNSTCTGSAASPCPASKSGTASISTENMAQGITNVTVKAYDAMGQVSNARTVTVFIDRSAPTIVSAAGPLVEGNSSLIGISSDLSLAVQDFGSGLGSLEVLLDNELLESRTLDELLELGAKQTCTGEVCELTYSTEALAGAAQEPGPHMFKLVVKDRLGQSAVRNYPVTFDTRTPEVALSGTLVDAQGEELPGPTGTLEVSANDGSGPYDAGVAGIEFAVDGQPVSPKVGLVVIDENNNRIQEFSDAGNFIRSFGTLGSGNGQLKRAAGVSIDPKGNIWVADAGNSRIQKFSETGQFLTKFGSNGEGNGQFYEPEGLTIDAKGNIWVADTYNSRLQVFNEKGEFIRTVSSYGSGPGQLGEPTGIDVGPGGNVWVADWKFNRVVVFSETGAFVRQFGTTGSGNGQFNHPDAIDVDSTGIVWVGDQTNNRVQAFNQQGEYLTQFGSKGSGAGQFSFGYPFGLERDSTGGIWVADANNHRIQKWTMPLTTNLAVPTYATALGSGGTGNGQFNHPANIALDGQGNMWVVDQNNHRIQEFTEAGTFVRSVGSSGTNDGQLKRPAGITVDPKGNIWVADTGNSRIQKFSATGQFLAKFGSYGEGVGQFLEPEAIVADPKGNIWVVDTYNSRLQVFNEKGEFIRTVGSLGSGPGQFGEPTGIDVGPGGNVWVTDWQLNRVVVFSETGAFVRQFGTTGSGNGQFNHPDAIDVDSTGIVWVGDQTNNRVQAFNQQGEYLIQFGSKGSGAGQFSFGYPMGLASDSRGNLWVSDTGNNRLQKWRTNNRPLYNGSFGSLGTANGQFNHPADLAVASVRCLPKVCPPQSTKTFTFSEATWGPGPHAITITVTDGVGNVDVEEVRVNEPLSVIAPTCPTIQPDVLAGGQTLGTSAALSSVQEILPDALKPSEASEEAMSDPSVTSEPEGVSLNELGIDVVKSEAGGGIENDAAGSFTVGQAACLQPLETTAAALAPTLVNDTAVIYPNSAPDTDTVIRPTAAGTAIIQAFRGEDPPDAFSWKVHLEPGQELVELGDGGVAVLDPTGFDFNPEVVPAPPTGGSPALTDAELQLEQAEYDLLSANAELTGEVALVVPLPELYLGTEQFVPGMLRITSPTVITAELPPNLVAETEAMIIRLSPPAEPESICASVMARAPEYAYRVCGGEDSESESGGEAIEPYSLTDLAPTGDPSFDAEITALANQLNGGAQASYEVPETTEQIEYCEKHRPRCKKFKIDGALAAFAEDDLYNNPDSDNTMANAFRHAVWNGFMVMSSFDDPIQALVYSAKHEENEWSTKNPHVTIPELRASRMDMMNNFFGYRHHGSTDLETCEVVRKKTSTEGIFMGPRVDPWKWAKRNGYNYNKPVFRRFRNYENNVPGGLLVYPTGRHCIDVRVGFGPIQVNPLVPPYNAVSW